LSETAFLEQYLPTEKCWAVKIVVKLLRVHAWM